MFSKVFATDLQPARLELAKRHGATALPLAELRTALAEATDGRGADAVLEVVGVEGAIRTGMELVRPYGVLSSVGVHGHERKLDGDLLYGKKYVSYTVFVVETQLIVQCPNAIWPMFRPNILSSSTRGLAKQPRHL
jgi:threonine dehydrogenase-like Zn-dependent dehydrogenase